MLCATAGVYIGNQMLGVTAPYLAVKLASDRAKDMYQLARGLLDALVSKEVQARSTVLGSATKSPLDPNVVHAIRGRVLSLCRSVWFVDCMLSMLDAVMQQFPLKLKENQQRHSVFQKITSTLSDKCRFLNRPQKKQCGGGGHSI